MMADPPVSDHEDLIRGLAAQLRPVRPVAPPYRRALLWLAVVAGLALVLAGFSDLHAVGRRLAAAPDMWLAVAGSSLTAILAAVATFNLSMPDRSAAWALLPTPAAILWIAASGAGCLRTSFLPGTHGADPAEMRHCLVFILAVSLPLTALLLVMLRRAYPLRPGLTAVVAGLAAASAAATLLTFFHPFDATATDLVVHAAAVAVVLAANQVVGGRILSARAAPPSFRA
jgi:hypothetical protein